MTILGFFAPKPKPIVTSKPIFQFSSSFLNDDDDYNNLEKPHARRSPDGLHPLPLCHQTHSQKEWHETRPKPQARLHLILHILNTIFTIISMALFLTVIPLWNANFRHARSLISTDYTDGLMLAPLILSLLTSCYLLLMEHSSLGAHLRPRFGTKSDPDDIEKPLVRNSMKPRTLVFLSLTILLTLVLTLALSGSNSVALAWRNPTPNKSGAIVCNLTNIFTRPCQPTLYQIGGLQIGGLTTGGLAWCVWLTVFVLAVRDWARERREKQEAAKERRRRRHDRRRGHEHGHSHTRRHRRHRDHNATTASNDSSANLVHHAGAHSVSHSSRSQSSKNQVSRSAPSHSQSRGTKFGMPPPLRVPSPAARLASHTVRPKETIQVWLNNRYAQI